MPKQSELRLSPRLVVSEARLSQKRCSTSVFSLSLFLSTKKRVENCHASLASPRVSISSLAPNMKHGASLFPKYLPIGNNPIPKKKKGSSIYYKFCFPLQYNAYRMSISLQFKPLPYTLSVRKSFFL